MGFEIQHSLDGKTWDKISFVRSKSISGNRVVGRWNINTLILGLA